MTDIYLSRIQIRNFRTFGRFEMEIPAGPGLVLLTGTNGLGKSSFFDSVEWGLTGEIRRFGPFVEKGRLLEGDYLTRRGADPGSHEVILDFSDGEQIQRSATQATPEPSIIAQLAKANRPTISSLSTYLALTHFLGQAAQQRFTSRDPHDQWQALKGPSGIEKLEEVRSGLRGRSTTAAFTRRVEAQRSAVSEIERQVAEWQGWQARLSRLQQAARASGSLPAEEVAQRARALEEELFSLLREPVPSIAGETGSQRLARLSDRLALALSGTMEREAALEQMADIITPFAAALVNSRPDHPVLMRVRQDLDAVRVALATATSEAEAAATDVAAQRTALATVEREVNLLEAVRADLILREDLVLRISETEAEVLTLSTSEFDHRAALAASEAALRTHAESAAKVAGLRSTAQRARAHETSLARLLQFETRASEDASALMEVRKTAVGAEAEIERLRFDSDALCRQIDELVAAQAQAERHASAINAAIASIASHIHENDTACPVCRTSFELGQLKLLATEAANSGDARLAAVASKIEQLRSKGSPLKARIQELAAIVEARGKHEMASSHSHEEALTARVALARDLGVDVNADLGAEANARLAQSQLDLARAEAALDAFSATAAVATEQRGSIRLQLEELIASGASASSRLNSLVSQNQDCADRITARGMAGTQIDILNARLSAQREYLEAARSQIVLLAEKASSATLIVEGLRGGLVAAERAFSDAEGVRSSADVSVASLALRWSESGLAQSPSQTVLDEALGEVRRDASTMRLINDQLQRLARDNQDALMQEEIKEIVEAMRTSGGAIGHAEPQSHLAELRLKEAEARAELKLTEGARKAVTSFTELLKRRAEEFSTQVLAPLNGIIDDFNDAMLSTPGESIHFKADHRVDATSFGMSLRYREQVEAAIEWQKNLPPQVVLSEGQLAANGFSILCAASTAYPWSRWRALLLDDPLQHNDIIHTAAFVDVMRNMVELRGYQLFMSSHDRAESDFIARKFDAAGLACSRITLTAPSEKGVVYEGPEHNLAAQRIIQSSTTSAQSSA